MQQGSHHVQLNRHQMENLQWSSQPVLNAVDTYLQRQNGYAQVSALGGDCPCLPAVSRPAY